jgi:hypothetical protein
LMCAVESWCGCTFGFVLSLDFRSSGPPDTLACCKKLTPLLGARFVDVVDGTGDGSPCWS